MARQDLQREFEGINYFFESIRNETKADLNLEDLARGNDPPGILARKLIILEKKEPDVAFLELMNTAKKYSAKLMLIRTISLMKSFHYLRRR